MNKKEYIQMATLLYRPKHSKDKNAIAWGLAMWDALTKAGYGDTLSKSKTKPKTRKSFDWYAKLEGKSKEYFDQFWSNWKEKKGRNEAASAWIKRGDMADREMQHLVYAASKFAATRAAIRAEGLTPIMAQGFINNRRDKDIERPCDVANDAMKAAQLEELRTLTGDLVHYQSLLDKEPDNKVYSDEVERIRKRIKTTKGLT